MLTILEGSTFCICDDRGDIAAETSGFFAHDTRFLSRLVLRVDGTAPLLLSSGRVEHFQAGFYLRNGTANGLPRDSISIAREPCGPHAVQETEVDRLRATAHQASDLVFGHAKHLGRG